MFQRPEYRFVTLWTQVDELVTLARNHFGALSQAEERALTAASRGTLAICGPNAEFSDAGNDPANSDQWPADREIRATLIRWTCVHRLARVQVDPKGLAVLGAKVVGKLDLTHTSPPFAIVLKHCRVGDAELASAELPELDLQGTWVDSVMADNIRVQGTVWLNKGFKAGRVRLFGAQIARDLDCGKGRFHNPTGVALGAERIAVKDSVFLKESRVDGEVRLLSAQIGSDLNCVGATLNGGPTGLALVADRADIGGSVFLRDRFQANGQVRFLNAEIRGDLTCRAGVISNPSGNGPHSGIAFNADKMAVGGSLFFREGFEADGLVIFNGAHIGSNLECDASIFKSPSGVVLDDQGTALDAEGVRVDGSAFFRNGFSARGKVRLPNTVVQHCLEWRGIAKPTETSVDLSNASVGVLTDELESWPQPGGLVLDGFTYARGEKGVQMRLSWIGRQHPFTPQPYRHLAKLHRDEGDDKAARKILFEMESLRHKERDGTWRRRLWGWTLRRTIGFGYYPEWSIYWLLGITVLGWILFAGGFAVSGIVPVDSQAYANLKKSGELPREYPRFYASVYSLENSVPLFKLGEAERWQPDPDPEWRPSTPAWFHTQSSRLLSPSILRFGRLGRATLGWTISPTFLRPFRWLQVIAGWFLTTMFVYSVTGLVRKD